jgi:hypothetical protein
MRFAPTRESLQMAHAGRPAGKGLRPGTVVALPDALPTPEEGNAMKKTILAAVVIGLGLLPQAGLAGMSKAERQSANELRCQEAMLRRDAARLGCLATCAYRAELHGEGFDIESCEARCENIYEITMAHAAERRPCRDSASQKQ